MADNPFSIHGSSSSGGGGNPFSIHTAPVKTDGGRGLLGTVERYSGAELVGNLAKDVGGAAIGVLPGLVHVAAGVPALARGEYHAIGKTIHHPWISSKGGFFHPQDPNAADKQLAGTIAADVAKQYADYYGHDVLHHLYKHPLQPLLDVLTVADLGATAGVRAGLLSGERATILTRSPRNVATGEGPVAKTVTSTKPLIRGRATLGAKTRTVEGIKIPKTDVRIGGEMKAYGKEIAARTGQAALSRLTAYEPFHKATRKLNPEEWAALHIRATGVHPHDLAEIWKSGTVAGDTLRDPKVEALVLEPSNRMLRAEPEAQALSAVGAGLYQQTGRLSEEAEAARPDLIRRQTADVLGVEPRTIPGGPDAYYFPHTVEPAKVTASPFAMAGGGKGVPRVPGSTKQNLGILSLQGKLHLRGDILGPEFLRRVKFVKYGEIHNALVRGAIKVSTDQVRGFPNGRLPQGWEYIREKASTRVPFTIRGEGETHVPIDQLIPDTTDLHGSPLSDGFGTTDIAKAHPAAGGGYYIVPSATVKAATGEFTRSNAFVRNFIDRPLKVWRAVVLGTRIGFLTNNLVGNSLMYAVKTGGQGALRDLFGAIIETHGPGVARRIADNAATPPGLRADLYREFFPEQIQGTFGRTQSPSTALGAAANAGTTITGAIPRLTSKVAEEYPRRALIRHYIRHSPEFKRVYEAMPKQTRTFEAAARRVLEGRGGKSYQRAISRQVNHALGDYLHLSHGERTVLRNALPFYAWYRAIVSTTFHLAADTPLRANALVQIGQIGKQWSDEMLGDVPHFLAGAIPLGEGKGGTKRVLGTQGLNPWATLPQLGVGASSDLTSLGLNVYPVALLQAYANEAYKQHTPRPQVSPAKLLAAALADIGVNLPPSRLVAPLPPSKLYPNRDRTATFLGQLGVPIKEYDPAEAARQKQLGR